MYKLEILHQCGKRVKIKSQKVLGPNSYAFRSYRGKTGRAFLPTPILNRVKHIRLKSSQKFTFFLITNNSNFSLLSA